MLLILPLTFCKSIKMWVLKKSFEKVRRGIDRWPSCDDAKLTNTYLSTQYTLPVVTGCSLCGHKKTRSLPHLGHANSTGSHASKVIKWTICHYTCTHTHPSTLTCAICIHKRVFEDVCMCIKTNVHAHKSVHTRGQYSFGSLGFSGFLIVQYFFSPPPLQKDSCRGHSCSTSAIQDARF